MSNQKPLKLPGSFEEALGDLLKVKPPAKGEKPPKAKRKTAARKKPR